MEVVFCGSPSVAFIAKNCFNNENQKETSSFFFEEGLLLIIVFVRALLRCIAGDEVTKVFKEVH